MEIMKSKEEVSLPCNHNSNYGNVILKDEGICISLRINNPFSNTVKGELIKYQDILKARYNKGFLSNGPNYTLKPPQFLKKLNKCCWPGDFTGVCRRVEFSYFSS